jgi:protein-S-isoprenylcysteine O-methyltransferase Ste14
MNTIMQAFLDRLNQPFGWLILLTNGLVGLCVLAVLSAIGLNFLTARQRGEFVQQQQRSPVATGTMLLFFAVFYGILRLNFGAFRLASFPLRLITLVFGLSLLITGCLVNIRGRLRLGHNWANQVTIYAAQECITTGVYALVRHPLYASLIWMFYGASLVYLNWAAFLANSCIFVPMMYYRARQEETLLIEHFRNYRAYRQQVGMFWPRFRRRVNHANS